MKRTFVILIAVLGLSAIGLTAVAQDKDCSDFNYQGDAQVWSDSNGGQLDRDNDGVACEVLPLSPVPLVVDSGK